MPASTPTFRITGTISSSENRVNYTCLRYSVQGESAAFQFERNGTEELSCQLPVDAELAQALTNCERMTPGQIHALFAGLVKNSSIEGKECILAMLGAA